MRRPREKIKIRKKSRLIKTWLWRNQNYSRVMLKPKEAIESRSHALLLATERSDFPYVLIPHLFNFKFFFNKKSVCVLAIDFRKVK